MPVRKHQFTVMIDTGASDNYVSQSVGPFAESTDSINGRRIETAGGGDDSY